MCHPPQYLSPQILSSIESFLLGPYIPEKHNMHFAEYKNFPDVDLAIFDIEDGKTNLVRHKQNNSYVQHFWTYNIAIHEKSRIQDGR